MIRIPSCTLAQTLTNCRKSHTNFILQDFLLINKNLLFYRRCPNRSRSPTLSLKKEYILDRFWNRGGSLFNVLNRGYPAHAWPDFLQNNRGRFGLIFDIGILYIKNNVCSQYNDMIELVSARPVYSKSTASVWR